MRILIRTPKLVLYVQLNNTLTARQIFKELPCISVVRVAESNAGVYFDTTINAVAMTNTPNVDVGDIVYFPDVKQLGIVMQPPAEVNANIFFFKSRRALIGHAVVSPGDFWTKVIPGSSITIEATPDEAPGDISRKLNQSEIDALIRSLRPTTG
jgi:hypothetical protein